jgi:CelD/BcsL family acetyltransferase involved in cellulose biosynthesis
MSNNSYHEQIEIVSDIEEFCNLKTEYEDLFNNSKDASIFQSFEFLVTWLHTFSNKFKKIEIIIIRDNNDIIIAVLPLYIRLKYSIRICQLIGDNTSDYCHFIIRDNVGEINQIISNYLNGNRSWDVLIINSFAVDTATYEILCKSNSIRLSAHCRPICHAHGVKLINTYEQYIHTLPSKINADTRRQIKRLRNLGELEFELIKNDKLKKELEVLAAMHTSRWQDVDSNVLFDNDLMQQYYLDVALSMKSNNILCFSKLKLGGETIALHYGFQSNKIFYYYIPVYDIKYKKYSPGRILLFELIKYAYSCGLQYFDFMSGDENYKNIYTNNNIELNNIAIFNKTIRGQAYRINRAYNNYSIFNNSTK